MDDLIGRIDGLLDEEDDYPWSDSWRSWGSAPWDLGESDDDRELDSGWDDGWDGSQIHMIPVEQVSEWLRCLETMPVAERGDVDWYVVCHRHKVTGEREVSCGCGNPSEGPISR